MSELWIENREHLALEFFPARHGECHRRRRIASYARYDVQQVLGVIRCPGAARQGEIITRTLALGAKLLGGGPHQWVEPVHRTGETPHRVSDEIVTAHVSELVQQHCPTTIERPPVALRWEHDGRREQPACKWHLRILTA